MSSTGGGTTEPGAAQKPDLLASRIYSQCHITCHTVVGSVSKKELSIIGCDPRHIEEAIRDRRMPLTKPKQAAAPVQVEGPREKRRHDGAIPLHLGIQWARQLARIDSDGEAVVRLSPYARPLLQLAGDGGGRFVRRTNRKVASSQTRIFSLSFASNLPDLLSEVRQ
jgi:hypothetical protein